MYQMHCLLGQKQCPLCLCPLGQNPKEIDQKDGVLDWLAKSKGHSSMLYYDIDPRDVDSKNFVLLQ